MSPKVTAFEFSKSVVQRRSYGQKKTSHFTHLYCKIRKQRINMTPYVELDQIVLRVITDKGQHTINNLELEELKKVVDSQTKLENYRM